MSIDRKIFVSTPNFDRSERHRSHDWHSSHLIAEDDSAYKEASEDNISLRMLSMGVMAPSGAVHYFNSFKYKLVINGEITRDNRGHIVPLVYKAMQSRLDEGTNGENGGIGGLSSYFAWLACDPQSLLRMSSGYLRYRPKGSLLDQLPSSTPGDVIVNGIFELRNQVGHQLTHGPAFFDAEAIVAHTAAFWQRLNLMYPNENAQTNLSYAVSTLIHIVDTNYNQALQNIALNNTRLNNVDGGHELAPAEISALILFRIFALVDYLYRGAVCESHGEQRLGKLNAANAAIAGAELHADRYKSAYVSGSSDPVLDHFSELRSLIANGIENTDVRSPCKPLGILVPDYGPTSARLSQMTVGTRPHMTISAYTPIRP